MPFRLASALLILLVSATSAWPAKRLVLVRHGSSAYSICLSRDASPSEKRGAEELQRFLREMSGARLPIVTDAEKVSSPLIFIGRSATVDGLGLNISWDRLGPEGFALKISGKHVVIAGGRLRGTMYGVYTFLEKLGCRWFAPGVSRIPRLPTIAVPPLDETQKPAFEYREPYFTEAFDKDWSARNKANGHFALLDESTGGKVQYYPFVHSFYEMIPPEKHFKEHPGYFSLIDGKRRVDRGQLCLTNPDVLRAGVEAVLEWIRQRPEATIFSVSQNDWEGWCECDNCRRVEMEEGGVHSGPILRYVNALAAEIEKRHPDKLIDTLAYWYSENPPLHARPRPNVRIRLCPIGVCEAHPYEKCERSAYFMKNLRAWSKITDQLYIWHYNTNFAHYLIPFPDFDELEANIPMYKRQGVVGVFLEGAYAKGGGGENAELRSYVMAKLLWDPAVDVHKAVGEFHQTYYGKAAGPMREYFDLLHREVRFPPRGMGKHIWIYNVPDFSEEFYRRAADLFRQADAQAGNDAVRSRVRKARLAFDYAELQRAMRFEVANGWYAPAGLNGLKSRFDAFLAAVRGFGITQLHEGWELDRDQQQFAAYAKPFRVVTIENADLRVDVVPDLSGRAVRIVDKRTGRNVLRGFETGERNQDSGGLGVFVYPDYYARSIPAAWQVESVNNASELALKGATPGGLKLRRVLRLDGASLVTETVAENPGPAPLDVVLQSRCDADPGNIDKARVSFRKRDGAAFEKNVIQPEEQPAGSETYSGPALPDAEWRVLAGDGAELLTNRFPNGEVERATAGWTAKGMPRVTLTLWSPRRTLTPGEKLSLTATYSLR